MKVTLILIAVAVGLGAFSSRSDLTSVTIPDSVSTIGYGVFSVCTNLVEGIWEPIITSSLSNGAVYYHLDMP